MRLSSRARRADIPAYGHPVGCRAPARRAHARSRARGRRARRADPHAPHPRRDRGVRLRGRDPARRRLPRAVQGPCRARFLALDPEAARSAVWADYVHPDDREVFAAIHDQAVATGSLDGQYRIIGADGVTRWVRDRGRIRREAGRTFLDGSVLDVTMVHTVQEELLATNAALEAARAEADRLGRIDPLTGVSNRRVLPELLDRRLAGGDQALGVLLLDIDHFKRINDGLGHG